MAKRITFGNEIIKLLEKNGFTLHATDFQQYRDYATMTYTYSFGKKLAGYLPQTPYIEFTVDGDTDGFIDGMSYENGRNGYGVEVKFIEDVKYFIENANKNSDLTESKNKDVDFFNSMSKKYNFTKEEKTRYGNKTYISVIGVLFDRINNVIKMFGRNSDEEYNALNDCWDAISTAKSNGFDVSYEEKKWNSIAGLPNYH